MFSFPGSQLLAESLVHALMPEPPLKNILSRSLGQWNSPTLRKKAIKYSLESKIPISQQKLHSGIIYSKGENANFTRWVIRRLDR